MEVTFELVYFKEALKDLEFWKTSGNKGALKKIKEILSALENNPYSSTPGEPEKLKYTEGFSRKVNKKDRVTYLVNEEKKEIIILRMRGHYDDD